MSYTINNKPSPGRSKYMDDTKFVLDITNDGAKMCPRFDLSKKAIEVGKIKTRIAYRRLYTDKTP